MDSLLQPLFRFLVLPVVEILVFLLPLILCGAVIRFLKSRVDDALINGFGRPPYYFFAVLGTPLHELSHLAACLLFRHQVRRFSIFSPDRSGRLGFVEHAYDPGSLYQRAGCFFIALAPMFAGLAVLYGALVLLFPEIRLDARQLYVAGLDAEAARAVFAALRESLGYFWRFFSEQRGGTVLKIVLYLVLAIGVGSHMFPSMTDLRGGLPGLFILYVLVCLLNGALVLLGFRLKTVMAALGALAGFALNLMVFIILALAAALAILSVIRAAKSRFG